MEGTLIYRHLIIHSNHLTFQTELIKNKEVLDDVVSFLSKHGRQISKVNEDQALVPKIAEVIRNELGTAPGILIEKDNKIFIVMPGVPFEMHKMMESYVIPKLKDKLVDLGYSIKITTLQTTGIGESVLFEKLGDLNELLNGGKLAFLPSQFGVKLRITVREETEELANNKMSEIVQRIRGKAGRYIFSNEDEPLEEVVARLLRERGQTIAIAESCTGGYISNFVHFKRNARHDYKYFIILFNQNSGSGA